GPGAAAGVVEAGRLERGAPRSLFRRLLRRARPTDLRASAMAAVLDRTFGHVLFADQISDRFVVEARPAGGHGTIGAVRVPLIAIRGLGPEAAQHILAVRAA